MVLYIIVVTDFNKLYQQNNSRIGIIRVFYVFFMYSAAMLFFIEAPALRHFIKKRLVNVNFLRELEVLVNCYGKLLADLDLPLQFIVNSELVTLWLRNQRYFILFHFLKENFYNLDVIQTRSCAITV